MPLTIPSSKPQLLWISVLLQLLPTATAYSWMSPLSLGTGPNQREPHGRDFEEPETALSFLPVVPEVIPSLTSLLLVVLTTAAALTDHFCLGDSLTALPDPVILFQLSPLEPH